jgi:anti-sigma factor ChrR (cupin superfamily)
MRARNVLAFGVSFILAAAAVLAQGSGASKPVTMPAAELKWVELDASAPGVKTADVWGDHTKGAFGAFTTFPAGWAAPLHTHTDDFRIVVISGTFIHTPEGKPEVRLGPGSYLLQPGGTYRHTTACDKSSDCMVFTQSKGKFDIIPVDAGKK